jgi:hypothetical protein
MYFQIKNELNKRFCLFVLATGVYICLESRNEEAKKEKLRRRRAMKHNETTTF